MSILRFVISGLAVVSIYAAFGLIPFLIAVALLVLLTVPGEQRYTIVPVPGGLRIIAELLVFVTGCVAAFQAFGLVAGSVMVAGTLLLVFIFSERWVWLLRQRL